MIRIVTDSLCDFTPSQCASLNIELMPLTVNFGDQSFESGYEITNEEFYEKLVTSSELPSTAQVNPYAFEEKFKQFIDQGDQVVAILFAKEMSGTYQSAVIAKDTLGSDQIYLIDSRTGSLAQGLLVSAAVKLRDQGKTAEQIQTAILELIPRAHVYIVLDTMTYLKKGGRISPTVAFVGGMLGVHPIIAVEQGQVALIDKVKGKKAMNRWMIEKLESQPIDPSYPLYIGHSNALDKALAFATQIQDKPYAKDTQNFCLGSVVGTHVGPNAIAIGYIQK